MASPPDEALVLLVLTALAGAAVLGVPLLSDAPESESSVVRGETLLNASIEALQSESIEGVRTETVERNGERETQTVAVNEDPPDQSVIAVLNASSNRTWDRIVINHSEMWRYDESENRALYSETEGYWLSETLTFGTNVLEVQEVYEVAYAGTETVADRDAHVVELTPPDDVVAELSVDVRAGDTEHHLSLFEADADETWYLTAETWWIAVDSEYPVKQRIEWMNEEGESVATTTRTYEELAVGVDHDEDTFTFEPPADAEITEPVFPDTEEFDDPEAAESKLPYDFPEPTVPDGYSLERISVGTLDGATTLMLTFLDGTNSLNVHVTDDEHLTDEDDLVETGVGDADGDLFVTGDRPALVWDCDGLEYRVTGSLDVDTLSDVADSLDECL